MQKLSPRVWFSLLLAGLTGQLAWTIENMYFNVYLYNTISTDPGYIAAMVAASAVVATLTTLLMGALSDRMGKRKAFIVIGYFLWGISTAAFGLVTVENAARIFSTANATAAAAIAVIALDCIMTFFGSTANDAAFNAYITDTVPNQHRGRVESVLAILPLVSILIIFGGFDAMTQQGKWQLFFFIFGLLVILTGIACLFLLKDPPLMPNREPFLGQLFYGFRPAVIRKHKALYLALSCFCIFSVAVQVFFPYLIIYMQHFLQLESYPIVLGVVLIVSSIVSVAMGKQIDRTGTLRFAAPAALLMLAGLLGMFFARSAPWVCLAGAIMMSGYMLVTAAFSAEIRNRTPAGKAGLFQGVRMIFAVMLPMIVGPFIGAWVIRGNTASYQDLGVLKAVPTPGIFLAAALCLLAVALPLSSLWRVQRSNTGTEQKKEAQQL